MCVYERERGGQLSRVVQATNYMKLDDERQAFSLQQQQEEVLKVKQIEKEHQMELELKRMMNVVQGSVSPPPHIKEKACCDSGCSCM
jgi:hypothetical protein